MGDFKINFNKDINLNTDAGQLIEATEAIGLIQHVTFITHNQGKILDHVYTDQTNSVNISRIASDIFLSDHRSIKMNITIPNSIQGGFSRSLNIVFVPLFRF